MKKYWQQIAAKIDTRNQRERGLIFVMALVVVAALLNALLIDPLLAKKKRLLQESTLQQTQLQDVRTQIQAIMAAGRADPDAPTRAQMAVLEQKLAQTSATLQEMQQGLVLPGKMANLLQDILSQNRSLKLVMLKTLPVSNVVEVADSKPGTGQAAPKPGETSKSTGPSIYKHGVEIAVSGSYAELTQYLETLEKLPWRMYWGKVSMRVEEHPLATLTITLFTLSMDKTWMAI